MRTDVCDRIRELARGASDEFGSDGYLALTARSAILSGGASKAPFLFLAAQASCRILPAVERKLRRRGIPGVFLDLEPHLKGGGQFGGFSGPDGMGVALRGLCRVLDYVGIGYHLRDFEDVRAARGF